MDDRELLARIDGHLERGNELAEQNAELVRGFRQFTQDMNARFERLVSGIETVMRDQSAAMRQQAAVMRTQGEAMRTQGEAMRNLAGRVEAQTQAVLWVLDELRGAHGGAG